METIRQGDVLFIPMNEIEKQQGHLTKQLASGIIQEGEATGHHHKLADLDAAEVFQSPWDGKYVRVGPLGVSIVHEEHAPVTLAPNTTYKVNIAREFDYLANIARRVRD